MRKGGRTTTALLLVVWLLGAGLAGGAGAEHAESQAGPGEPRRDFPKGFRRYLPVDSQSRATATTPAWEDPHVGGWGSRRCRASHRRRRPVVFVHGTTQDAWFWRAAESDDGTIVNVRKRFLRAGYCPRELWDLLHGRARLLHLQRRQRPGPLRVHPRCAPLSRGSQGQRRGSLAGVTVVRKAAFVHRELYRWIGKFVAIAAANHGTTSCRNAEDVSHVCEELHPGSPWLKELNGFGETPRGPRYLTILEGTGTTDNFYLGDDARSPDLAGACNHHMPYTGHNSLARGRTPVRRYRAFLKLGRLPSCGAPEGSSLPRDVAPLRAL